METVKSHWWHGCEFERLVMHAAWRRYGVQCMPMTLERLRTMKRRIKRDARELAAYAAARAAAVRAAEVRAAAAAPGLWHPFQAPLVAAVGLDQLLRVKGEEDAVSGEVGREELDHRDRPRRRPRGVVALLA